MTESYPRYQVLIREDRKERLRAEDISWRSGPMRQGLDLQMAGLWQGWVQYKREEPPLPCNFCLGQVQELGDSFVPATIAEFLRTLGVSLVSHRLASPRPLTRGKESFD